MESAVSVPPNHWGDPRVVELISAYPLQRYTTPNMKIAHTTRIHCCIYGYLAPQMRESEGYSLVYVKSW